MESEMAERKINISTSRTSNGLYAGYVYDVETRKYLIWTAEYSTRTEAFTAAKQEAAKQNLRNATQLNVRYPAWVQSADAVDIDEMYRVPTTRKEMQGGYLPW